MAIDWRKNELEIETEDGLATYRVADAITYKTNELGAQVEVVHPGKCLKCGIRVFVSTSHPICADAELGVRLAAFVTAASNEPAAVYCQEHYLTENPHIAQQIQAGIVSDIAKSEAEALFEKLTVAMGGTR